ncbi:MAG: hypothetical protein M3389_14870 [Actinomycetota bacterium]|nr:hypothetical protein [Actinomycetota bacterium]
MTYLDSLRLHFAGRFQASVSTINNTPSNWDISNRERFGSWNPEGDGDWRLIGCKVTSAWNADGTPVADDPVLQCTVADADARPPAKLVDLDSEQQLVSTIFGLQVRIADAQGNSLVRGEFTPAPFSDLWSRATEAGNVGDMALGAQWQSIVTDLEWADPLPSGFLQALRTAAADGLLSIKFNVDGYEMDSNDPNFTRGRIVGTIGPQGAAEPAHLVAGRHFLLTAEQQQASPTLNACVAVVDEQAGKVLLDVGNATLTTVPGGPPANVGDLRLTCGSVGLGTVQYDTPGWYESTAGVVALPQDRALTADELATVADTPLALAAQAGGLAIAEPPGGLYCRADGFVFRLDPGESAEVRVVATKYGKPYANAEIVAALDPSQLQQGPGAPPVAVPEAALTFAKTGVKTAGDGVATLTITASDPGNPRGYIDGQVYGVRPGLAETADPKLAYPFNPWDFVSLLVYDAFDVANPTWVDDLQPIFQQYADLYPVMARFLDLSSYEEVVAKRRILLYVFALPLGDPNSMPVTRDVSNAKRAAILRWLQQDPPPHGGDAPAPSGEMRVAAAPGASPVPRPQVERAPSPGGKTTAAANKVGRSTTREA